MVSTVLIKPNQTLSNLVMILKKGILTLFFFSAGIALIAQPANDLFANAIDISDGNWYSGDNTNATRACACDITKSICDRTATDCNGTFAHTTNMCCGVEGVESSIWYKFNINAVDTVYIDVRNIACNPTSFFGITTSVQGFVISKVNDLGCDPCSDSIWDCFSMDDANDAEIMMVESTGNNNYFIEVDTKKNSFSTCDCANSDPACHSTCTFEIRIRRANSNLARTELNLTETPDGVSIDWSLSPEQIIIKRIAVQDNTSVELFRGNPHLYKVKEGSYTFPDSTISKKGLYRYELYTISDNGENIKAKKTILYNGIQQPQLLIWPNPTDGVLHINCSDNMQPDAIAVYNIVGERVLYDNSGCQKTINMSKYPPGVYVVEALVKGKRIKRKVILAP